MATSCTRCGVVPQLLAQNPSAEWIDGRTDVQQLLSNVIAIRDGESGYLTLADGTRPRIKFLCCIKYNPKTSVYGNWDPTHTTNGRLDPIAQDPLDAKMRAVLQAHPDAPIWEKVAEYINGVDDKLATVIDSDGQNQTLRRGEEVSTMRKLFTIGTGEGRIDQELDYEGWIANALDGGGLDYDVDNHPTFQQYIDPFNNLSTTDFRGAAFRNGDHVVAEVDIVSYYWNIQTRRDIFWGNQLHLNSLTLLHRDFTFSSPGANRKIRKLRTSFGRRVDSE